MISYLFQQFTVKTFINDVVETYARIRNQGLIFRVLLAHSCFAEVGFINAARKTIDIFVSVSLGFIQAFLIRKNNIGLRYQLIGSRLKSGQVIYAIIDNTFWEKAGSGKHFYIKDTRLRETDDRSAPTNGHITTGTVVNHY